MYSCYCLNILIEALPENCQGVSADSLSLSPKERDDSFFQQDLKRVKTLQKVHKTHPDLVLTKDVGKWVINCCANCVCETYAVHNEKGPDSVLIFANLRDTKSIERAKTEEADYSKVFKIVISRSPVRANSSVLYSYPQCNPEAAMNNIKDYWLEYMKKETIAVEQRIKQFADEEYEKFNNLKTAAMKEQGFLNSFIQEMSQQQKHEVQHKAILDAVKEADKMLCVDVCSPEYGTKINKSTRPSPKRQKSSPAAPSSYDAEAIFEMEGSEDNKSVSGTDVEESDREDTAEGAITMPVRHSVPKHSIAKSLPMDIPTFLTQNRNHVEDEYDDLPRQENVNIAESIKALAQSVHGDAVFGELPRPRVSNQL
ncbi:unnamed protein product [Callosobruchus maculatus]|uniref:Uncharacterized protein n=1 Tax=Callosobruchus maculatus TaxID=64391 RepID=A0A653CEY1_CALMS|nr:unnamed protein product [Callosobruchus maculatus]